MVDMRSGSKFEPWHGDMEEQNDTVVSCPSSGMMPIRGFNPTPALLDGTWHLLVCFSSLFLFCSIFFILLKSVDG